MFSTIKSSIMIQIENTDGKQWNQNVQQWNVHSFTPPLREEKERATHNWTIQLSMQQLAVEFRAQQALGCICCAIIKSALIMMAPKRDFF